MSRTEICDLCGGYFFNANMRLIEISYDVSIANKASQDQKILKNMWTCFGCISRAIQRKNTRTSPKKVY